MQEDVRLENVSGHRLGKRTGWMWFRPPLPFVPLETRHGPAQPCPWLLSQLGRWKGLSSSDPHPAGSVSQPNQRGQCRVTPWPQGTTAPGSAEQHRQLRALWGARGGNQDQLEKPGHPRLGKGMSLEKSKGAFLCLQGGIQEKEKPLSADTRLGQAALLLEQDSCSGLGTGVGTDGHRSSVVGICWSWICFSYLSTRP